MCNEIHGKSAMRAYVRGNDGERGRGEKAQISFLFCGSYSRTDCISLSLPLSSPLSPEMCVVSRDTCRVHRRRSLERSPLFYDRLRRSNDPPAPWREKIHSNPTFPTYTYRIREERSLEKKGAKKVKERTGRVTRFGRLIFPE